MTGPLYVDVAALLDGQLPDPPRPCVLTRRDGKAVFYAGQTNFVFGDPESGKTLLALAAVSETLGKPDGGALVVDCDHNGIVGTLSRLLDLGAPEGVLRDPARFRYVEPEDASHLRAVVADAQVWRPDIAVVDSVGEVVPMFGGSSNSPDDFTVVNSLVLKPLAMAGAAVVAVDHLAKGSESRAAGPTGTAAKKRAVGGVSIRVTIAEAFVPGRGGAAVLTIHKDRHGQLRRWCPTDGREPAAGVFALTATPGGMAWEVRAPEKGDTATAAGVNEDDLDTLDRLDPPPSSVRDLKSRLSWGSDRALNTLAEWRSRNVPPEQRNTRPGGVPGVFRTPTPRNTGTPETAGQSTTAGECSSGVPGTPGTPDVDAQELDLADLDDPELREALEALPSERDRRAAKDGARGGS